MNIEEVQAGDAKPIDRQSIVAFLKWLRAQGVTFARLHVHTTRCYERNSLACGHREDSFVPLSIIPDDLVSLFERSFGQVKDESLDPLQFAVPPNGPLALIENLVTKVTSPGGSPDSEDQS